MSKRMSRNVLKLYDYLKCLPLKKSYFIYVTAKSMICVRWFRAINPNATMAFSLKNCVGILCIGLISIPLCMAAIQSVTTKFTEGKILSTSYTTLQKISKIQCVDRCNKDRQTSGCTLAGYNKATRSCYLSVDGPLDVLDTTDEAYGVFFYEPYQNGRYYFKF